MRKLSTWCAIAAMAAGCASAAPPPPAPAPAPAAAAAPVPAAAPARLDAVVVVYGRMTFVMDSPRGQQDKAEAAVRASDLVAQLTAWGLAVTYRFDEHGGDDVVVTSPAGAELGRVPLMDVAHKGSSSAVIDHIRARAGR